MKYLIFLFPAILLLHSCATSQLFETVSVEKSLASDSSQYVFENDSVRIEYHFWHEAGKMDFRVTNKMNVPIYIDWKKSVFILNDLKKDYWSDRDSTVTRGTIDHGWRWGYGYYGGSYSGNSVTSRQERLSFLPPHADEVHAHYAFVNYKGFNMKKFGAENTTQASLLNPQKTQTVKTVQFTGEMSPTRFRNFLTLSTSEKFDKEFYIDNSFYVSKVTEMKRSEFQGRAIKDKSGNSTFDYPYAQEKRFFIEGISGQ